MIDELQRAPSASSSAGEAALERLRRGLEDSTQLMAAIAMTFAAVVLAFTVTAVGGSSGSRSMTARVGNAS